MSGAPLTKRYETYLRSGVSEGYLKREAPIYVGSLVGVGADGLAAALSPEEPMRFLGVAEAVSGAEEARQRVQTLKVGSFVYRADGFEPEQSDVGRVVYGASDWGVRIEREGLAHACPVGTIVSIEHTQGGFPGVRVRIDRHTV